MDLAVSLLISAVLTTAEICATPLEGGADTPQFCHLAAAQKLETPYFSVQIEPGLFVGVDRQGRRLRVQPTRINESAYFTIEVYDGIDLPKWSDCSEVTATSDEIVTWHDCRIASEGFHERRLAARLKDTYVMIRYRYSSPGTKFAPFLERMTQSVRVRM